MKGFFLLFILFSLASASRAQVHYHPKVEASYLHYYKTYIKYEIDPLMEGDPFALNQSVTGLNLVNGFGFWKDRIYTGLGVGYLNAGGNSGLLVFTDLEFTPFDDEGIVPFISFRTGLGKLWYNQGVTRSVGMADLCLGFSYSISHRLRFYVKSGVLITGESFFIPVVLGVRL